MKIKDAIYLIEPSKKQDKKYDVYLVSFSKLNSDPVGHANSTNWKAMKIAGVSGTLADIPKSWRKFTMDGLDKDDIVKKYIVSFGQKGMEQFKDKFGYYKDLDHNDKKRKDAYRARHKKDNINDPNYAGYWSWNYLWT